LNVLLIDDHPLFREGLALLLQPLVVPLVIWQAGSCEEGFALLEKQGPADLVLIDMALPRMQGLEGIRQLRARWPATTVVALSSSDDRDTVLHCIDAGAMGFIPKSSASEVLIPALKLILARGIYLPPSTFVDVRQAAADDGAEAPALRAASAASATPGGCTPQTLGLSPRQSEVLYLILQGKAAKLIERELSLSASTVKAHTSAVLRALNVTTRTQAVVAAGRVGLRFEGG
jgi:DNA-binding NarL/FixJ family response regulator